MTELGEIPKDWGVNKLGDILKVKYGKSQKQVEDPSGSIPILGTGGLMGYANKALYEEESVLIGRKGTIDKPYYMDEPFWTVDTLFYSEIFKPNIP
ncbi:restriction endonuclease subunit S, partial [Pseudomonas sp. 2822-17]|uniref:restriction endonuclease subunit S n=1 Tax=Pseudomonas sp. 2822-17 TaxID=1712678 RepID=UPI0015B24E92